MDSPKAWGVGGMVLPTLDFDLVKLILNFWPPEL